MGEPGDIPDAIIERHEPILDELATLGLLVARELQQRLSAEEDNEVAARLGMAFHAACRSARQSLALKARLDRELIRNAREDRDDREAQTDARRRRRLRQVKDGVQQLIWTEAEPDTMVELEARLQLLLGPHSEAEDFLQGPVARHIRRMCHRLGLDPASAADPAEAAASTPWPPDPAPRRSSA